jgi:transcriptional regulator with XRE-family HTH domain
VKNFGDTIRELRLAQDLGLRETAGKIGISPAYLSRIERGKENPPKAEIIKVLAKELAADPDILFRLSSHTDPEVTNFIKNQPKIMELFRFLTEAKFTSEQLTELIGAAKSIKENMH